MIIRLFDCLTTSGRTTTTTTSNENVVGYINIYINYVNTTTTTDHMRKSRRIPSTNNFRVNQTAIETVKEILRTRNWWQISWENEVSFLNNKWQINNVSRELECGQPYTGKYAIIYSYSSLCNNFWILIWAYLFNTLMFIDANNLRQKTGNPDFIFTSNIKLFMIHLAYFYCVP